MEMRISGEMTLSAGVSWLSEKWRSEMKSKIANFQAELQYTRGPVT